MNAIPCLTIEDVANLDGVLGNFLTKAEAELTVVIDRGGNVISQFGDMGAVEFNALYHQGNGNHIFMNSVDDDTIMITVFGSRTTVGLVRFYSASTAQSVAALLKSLQNTGHGFSFDASDITATPVFADQ